MLSTNVYAFLCCYVIYVISIFFHHAALLNAWLLYDSCIPKVCDMPDIHPSIKFHLG